MDENHVQQRDLKKLLSFESFLGAGVALGRAVDSAAGRVD